MEYKVYYSKDAIKDLKKLDPYTRKIIFAWIEKNLVGSKNPRHTGKSLVAKHLDKWKYRVATREFCPVLKMKIYLF